MKVLILNNRYPTKKKPFVASYIKSIEAAISKSNEIKVLVHEGNSDSKIMQLLDLLVYNIKILFSTDFTQADIIFANHFNLYWNSLKTRLNPHHKLIIHWHGSELFGSKRFRNFSSWSEDDLFMNAVHIVPSEYFKREVIKQFQDLKIITVIPSGGVDTTIFFPKGIRDKNTITIGFASHLHINKGVDFFIDLVKKRKYLEQKFNKEFNFMAINYGLKEKSIMDQLIDYDVDVLPPISKKAMPDFYNNLDLLVFATRGDSLGLVPIEAMACGIPVICPNEFACPEYCQSGVTGELYEAGNLKDFISSVEKVITNITEYTPEVIINKKYSKQKIEEEYIKALKL